MANTPTKSRNIEALKKLYHKQWLLVAVDKANAATTTPISGRLIAHSPHRVEIYRIAMNIHHKNPLLIEYSEDKLPKGFAVAF